jgi:YesN/AraC family two-component response regulator
MRLLIYAEENYKTSCLLEDAAAAIGYDYAYISKKFKRTIGIPFRKYINSLRIVLAKQLLIKETKTITSNKDQRFKNIFKVIKNHEEISLLQKILTYLCKNKYQSKIDDIKKL